MAKKTLQNLANYYKVDNFGEYVLETWLNGNKSSAVELFKEMKPKDQGAFLMGLIERYKEDAGLRDGMAVDSFIEKLIYVVLPF